MRQRERKKERKKESKYESRCQREKVWGKTEYVITMEGDCVRESVYPSKRSK